MLSTLFQTLSTQYVQFSIITTIYYTKLYPNNVQKKFIYIIIISWYCYLSIYVITYVIFINYLKENIKILVIHNL